MDGILSRKKMKGDGKDILPSVSVRCHFNFCSPEFQEWNGEPDYSVLSQWLCSVTVCNVHYIPWANNILSILGKVLINFGLGWKSLGRNLGEASCWQLTMAVSLTSPSCWCFFLFTVIFYEIMYDCRQAWLPMASRCPPVCAAKSKGLTPSEHSGKRKSSLVKCLYDYALKENCSPSEEILSRVASLKLSCRSSTHCGERGR